MAAQAGTYLTVAEVAGLLRLKERRVYALARTGALPSRRVTGRLLFARSEVEAWLQAAQPTPAKESPAVLVGSHDPLLDWALRESGCGIASFCDGSLDGLARLERGEAVLAGLHLAEGEGAWNRGHVQERLAGANVALLEWAWRERGFIVAAGNPLAIRGLTDLALRRVVARQERAGSQVLLEDLLKRAGLAPMTFAGRGRCGSGGGRRQVRRRIRTVLHGPPVPAGFRARYAGAVRLGRRPPGLFRAAGADAGRIRP